MALSFVVSSGCNAAQTPPPKRTDVPVRASALPSSIAPATTATASASASASVSAVTMAVLDGISCGDVTCSRGQVCCKNKMEERGKCVPPGPRVRAECVMGGGMAIECDESGDCPTGKVCCELFEPSVDIVYECAALPCKTTHEVCGAGAKCAPGYACEKTDRYPGARCYFTAASVACGKGKVCSKQTPVCHWKDGVGTCVGRASLATYFTHYECDDRADCGPGYVCVYPTRGPKDAGLNATSCRGHSGHSYPNATITCRKDADCTSQTKYYGMPSWACVAADVGPPGLRVCRPLRP